MFLRKSYITADREEADFHNQVTLQNIQRSERAVLDAIDKVSAQHQQRIDELQRSITNTTSPQGPLPSIHISVARTWLQKNSPVVRTFSKNISAYFQKDHDIRNRILKSLSFPELYTRYDSISKAEAQTFGWIYLKKQRFPELWSNFSDWMTETNADQRRVYWISGKPGSGKSTLMRYLEDNPKTLEKAMTWAGSHDLILASCYFWNSGTSNQKSCKGLLQTLLHQLLVQLPHFPTELFSSRTENRFGKDVLEHSWSVAVLREAIFKLINQYEKSSNFLLLIDGLDEFHGNDEQRSEVCDIIDDLSRLEHVKICTASRPWNIYINRFGQGPKLRLQDLTKADIKTFVAQRFESNQYFIEWQYTNPVQCLEFTTTIVEKAQGVFLWVRLVVQSLLTGLSNSDDAIDLTRRLDEIPADLEAYFDKMMGNLDPFYHEHASQAFQFAAMGPSLLLLFKCIPATSITTASPHHTGSLAREDIANLQSNADRQINAWCSGLLESHKDIVLSYAEGISIRKVDFLHRTARDFICSEQIIQRLRSWNKTPFAADIELPGCYLRFCKLYFPTMSKISLELRKHLLDMIFDQVETLLKFDAPNSSVMDELAVELTNVPVDLHDRPDNPDLHLERDLDASFLALTLGYAQNRYCNHVLRNCTRLPAKSGRPLLDYALNSEWLPKTPSDEMTESVKRLLLLGANPSECYQNRTVWDRYLDCLSSSAESYNSKSAQKVMDVLIVLVQQPSVGRLWDNWQCRLGARDPIEAVWIMFKPLYPGIYDPNSFCKTLANSKHGTPIEPVQCKDGIMRSSYTHPNFWVWCYNVLKLRLMNY